VTVTAVTDWDTIDTDDDGFSDEDESDGQQTCGDLLFSSRLDSMSPQIERSLYVTNSPLYLTTADAGRFMPATFTIEMWVRQPVTNTTSTLWSRQAAQNYSLSLYAGRPRLIAYDVNTHLYQVTGLRELPADRWHHVAATYGGSNDNALTLYVDGVMQASVRLRAPLKRAPYNGSIDMGGANGSNYVDEIRFWNVARTPAQLAQYRFDRINTPSNEANLVACYRFNDGGDYVEDYVHPNDTNTYGWIVTPSKGCVTTNEARWLAGVDDLDYDGLPNWFERLYEDNQTSMVATADDDGDRLNNEYEYLADCNPKNADSDIDGIPDRDEDPDADALVNSAEQSVFSDPRVNDTDDDGYPDALDIQTGGNATNMFAPADWYERVRLRKTDYLDIDPSYVDLALSNWTVAVRVQPFAANVTNECTFAERQVAAGEYTWWVGLIQPVSGVARYHYAVRFTDADTDELVTFTSTNRYVGGHTNEYLVIAETHPHTTRGQMRTTLFVGDPGEDIFDITHTHVPKARGAGPVVVRVGDQFEGWVTDVGYGVSNLTEVQERALRDAPQDVSEWTAGQYGLVAYYPCNDGTSTNGLTSGEWDSGGEVGNAIAGNDWQTRWRKAATIIDNSGDAMFDRDPQDNGARHASTMIGWSPDADGYYVMNQQQTGEVWVIFNEAVQVTGTPYVQMDNYNEAGKGRYYYKHLTNYYSANDTMVFTNVHFGSVVLGGEPSTYDWNITGVDLNGGTVSAADDSTTATFVNPNSDGGKMSNRKQITILFSP